MNNSTDDRHDSGPMPRKRANLKLMLKLAVVAVCMFGFGFAMVPLYGVFCDITGFGGRSIQVAEAGETASGVSDRKVRIQFVATTNSALPWVFQPMESSSTITLGEMAETTYLALNPTDSAIVGHATYNVSPPEASLYFVKTECFCFTQQLLNAQESREMPVYYFIQPDLPAHIREITLSYTFYRNDDADAVALATTTSVRQQ